MGRTLAVRFGQPISLFDLIGAQHAMEAALGRAVDLIPVDDAYPFVRQSMANDLIVIYEADKEEGVTGGLVDAQAQ